MELDDLVGVVREHGEGYREFVGRIAPGEPPAAQAVYERYLFVLLSRHCELARTVRAFRLLRGRFHTEAEPLGEALRSGRIGFSNTWAPQIAAFTRAFCDDPARFLPAPGEPFPEARDRIVRDVMGLGPAKTAFALGLVYPFEATVCCIDVHIARLLAPLMELAPAAVPRHFRAAEALLAEVAGRAGFPLSATHWLLWDYQRHGRIEPGGSESVRLIGPLFDPGYRGDAPDEGNGTPSLRLR